MATGINPAPLVSWSCPLALPFWQPAWTEIDSVISQVPLHVFGMIICDASPGKNIFRLYSRTADLRLYNLTVWSLLFAGVELVEISNIFNQLRRLVYGSPEIEHG